MNQRSEILLRLQGLLSEHDGVSHWAISMRLLGKGDFFRHLKAGAVPRRTTFKRALQEFSNRWPADLAWPSDIPRPEPSPGSPAAKEAA